MQRNALQVSGQSARPLNLLDPSIMPVTKLNGSTFPAYDAALAATAPPPNTPNYEMRYGNTLPPMFQTSGMGSVSDSATIITVPPRIVRRD